MTVISFRGEDEHSRKLQHLATQTGWNVSQVLRALVDAADLAPVTSFHPVIKNTGTPDGGMPVFNSVSGTGQGAGQNS